MTGTSVKKKLLIPKIVFRYETILNEKTNHFLSVLNRYEHMYYLVHTSLVPAVAAVALPIGEFFLLSMQG